MSFVGAFNAKPSLFDRRKNMKYRIDTMSTTASGVVPIAGASKYPVEPTIYFTREAWVKQCHLVGKCTKEVGWFALVDFDEKDGSFTIFELVVPKQEVTAAETDIGKEDLADAAMELIEQGKDTSKMYAWFHSHVNMGVSPSGQDEFQVEDFLEDLADQPEVPAFIRGIQNKKGDLKLDVYFIQHGIAYQNVEFFVLHDDDPQWRVDIDNEIKAKVTERTYQPYYYGSGSGGNRNQAGKSGNVANAGQGFRRSGWEDWDEDEYYAAWGLGGYDDTPKLPAPVASESVRAPAPVDNPQVRPADMEVVYQSPTQNIDVLQDKEGKLWVWDEAADLYPYDEFTEYYGEIDGDTFFNYTGIGL